LNYTPSELYVMHGQILNHEVHSVERWKI